MLPKFSQKVPNAHTWPGWCLSLQTEEPKSGPLSPSAVSPLLTGGLVHFSVQHKNKNATIS